jgi:hypothetical protein
LPHRLLSVTAAGLLVGSAPAGHAAAEPTGPELRTTFEPVTIASGGDGTDAHLWGFLAPAHAPPRTRRVTWTVDFTAVAGFADIDFDTFGDVVVVIGSAGTPPSAAPAPPCTKYAAVLSCSLAAAEPVAGIVVELGSYRVRPTPSAVPRDSGTVRVTARVDDAPAVTSESRVTIGEGVDLAAAKDEEVSARPGGTTTVRPLRHRGRLHLRHRAGAGSTDRLSRPVRLRPPRRRHHPSPGRHGRTSPRWGHS